MREFQHRAEVQHSAGDLCIRAWAPCYAVVVSAVEIYFDCKMADAVQVLWGGHIMRWSADFVRELQHDLIVSPEDTAGFVVDLAVREEKVRGESSRRRSGKLLQFRGAREIRYSGVNWRVAAEEQLVNFDPYLEREIEEMERTLCWEGNGKCHF